ncbi:putative dihydrofolate synthetase [Cladobotryum mycophilum]|uniref:Dihydrofolate synthetase n=1 Tax=Cladobotryum mycophilum TaxID=491253 RepID=A0ABR0SKC2_9HYPO
MPTAKEVSRALARIRAVMPAEKKVDAAHRNIRLGLERISRVVPEEQSWIGVHVGGTNGKGSICSMLSGLFKLSGISHGMYTSPAMPERHNGVTINGLYINPRMHEQELKHIEAKFKRISSGWRFTPGEDPGDLTPFELETAAALRLFNKMHVKYGIVEVGMGGATDATNAMKHKSVTVISKIDLDHQEYLGNTIEEIAKVKAGIMRPGVPCIVDHTNPGSVLKVLREHANKIGTQISPTWKGLPLLSNLDTDRFKLEDYQKQNLLCATLAFRHLFPNLEIDVNRLLATEPYPPGRKERVGVLGLTGGLREQPVLVDGAHNMLGVQALAAYVENQVRKGDEPVSWVMGLSASKSKPFAKLIDTLVKPQDNFAFVEYVPGPNEPPPAPAELGRDIAKAVVKSEDQLYDGEPTVGRAVQWACEKAGEGPVMVTGSLYLIRNFYNLEGIEQKRKLKTRRPGPAQLWHYIQLSQQRPLTPEEAREFKQARRHWHLSPVRNPAFRQVGQDGQAIPRVVPERIRGLQRAIDFHKKQADGYRSAIKSAQKDIEKESAESSAKPSGDDLATLNKSVEALKARQEQHLKAYNSTMFRLRGYIVDPKKKFMSHEEVFGFPEKPKVREFPFPEEERMEAAQDVTATPVGDSASETPQTTQEEGRDVRVGDSRFTKRRGRRSSRNDGQEQGSQSGGNEKVAAEAHDLVSKLTSARR